MQCCNNDTCPEKRDNTVIAIFLIVYNTKIKIVGIKKRMTYKSRFYLMELLLSEEVHIMQR